MLGIRLIGHAISMVFSNIGAALRISVPIFVTSLVFIVLFAGQLGRAYDGNEAGYQGLGIGFVIIVVLTVAAVCWTAVAWHRYILLQENPGMFLPKLDGNLVLGYIGRSILLGLVLIIPGIALSFLGGGVAFNLFAASPYLAVILITLIIYVPLFFLFYRFSLILPAGAIGKHMTLGNSWSDTASASGAIVVVSLVMLAVSVVFELVIQKIFGSTSVSTLVVSAVIDWFMMMIGLSILTTLYGHLVEGRELRA